MWQIRTTEEAVLELIGVYVELERRSGRQLLKTTGKAGIMLRSFHWQLVLVVLLLGTFLTGCAIVEATDRAQPNLSDSVQEPFAPGAQTPQAMQLDELTVSGTYGESERDYLATVAMRDLSERLGISAIWISVDRVSPRQFADSSLGLPKPDHVYNQVITPGYIIQLKAEGKLYRYHGSGRRIVYGGPVAEASSSESVSRHVVQSPDPDLRAITLVFATTAAESSEVMQDSMTSYMSVERMVEQDEVTPNVALELLFRGPTETERSKGASSCFSTETQGLFRSLHVLGDIAYVDLNEPAGLLDTLTHEQGLALFDSQILQTLQAMIDVERVIYAIEGEPAAFYRWVGLGCTRENGFCDSRPFVPTPVPLAQASPTPQGEYMLGINAKIALGQSTTVVRQIAADLDGDGEQELVVLGRVGFHAEGVDDEYMQLSVIQPGDTDPVVVWQTQTRGLAGEPLETRDLNGDGLVEVLSPQTTPHSESTLYVVTWDQGAYDLLRPFGGRFDGFDAFGEMGFGLQDGDGAVEILAVYGPSGTRVDTYRWNGERFVYEATDDYSR